MSALHMPYDEPSYFFQSSRDPHEYEMATALDISPLPYAQRYMADSYNEYAPPWPPALPESHSYYDPSMAAPFSQSLFPSASSPDMRHPVPRRPVSPSLLASGDVGLGRKHSLIFSDGGSISDYSDDSRSSFSSDSFHQPSMFVQSHLEGATAQPSHFQPDPPQPQPSWAMSGSLDPATGIYQTAPEHPRVRTQQACEKCRGRKAKCSGERPCQRCCNRGLVCEYAPERKMRGPNKTKRKGGSKERSSRRASIASSIASTASEHDPMDNSSSSKAPVTDPRQFTMRLDVPPLASEGSLPPSATPSPVSDHMQASPTRGKFRPEHITLAGTGFYDQVPSALPLFDDQHLAHYRRASLPSHLLENNFRRVSAGRRPSAQDVYSPPRRIDYVENTPRPRSSPAFPREDFMPFATMHSAGSSSGTSSSSTPITPISMPMLDSELSYPEFPPTSTGFTPDFSSFNSFESSSAWLADDADATPTLGSGADAKVFNPFNGEFVSESPK